MTMPLRPHRSGSHGGCDGHSVRDELGRARPQRCAGLRRQSHHRPIAAIVVEGIICIAFGLLTLLMPGVTAVAWLFLVSGFAIVSGVLHFVAGLRLRKETPGEWTLILDGVLTVILGILMVLLPWAGLLALVWLVGAYSLFFGILLLVTAFRVRAGRAQHPRAA